VDEVMMKTVNGVERRRFFIHVDLKAGFSIRNTLFFQLELSLKKAL